jgi:hypothetical protein
MRASSLTFAALLAGQAVAHSHASPRTSLLGSRSTDDVRAARARALPLACAGAARATLSARALTARAPPSGLVDVLVSWAVEWTPRAGEDVLAVSCDAGAHVADVVDFVDVAAGARAGNVTLQLPHATGCAFAVKYVRGGGPLFGAGDASACAIAATVPRVRLGADNDPVGTRLAFGDAAGDMILTWASLDGTAPAVVRVGTASGGPYTQTFTSNTPHSYAAADSCHPPASEASPLGYVFPGYFHTVSLNLTAGCVDRARHSVDSVTDPTNSRPHTEKDSLLRRLRTARRRRGTGDVLQDAARRWA